MLKGQKKHPNVLKDANVWNTLYINASKLDFGNITTDLFDKLNTITPTNTLNEDKPLTSASNSSLRATVYALGRIDMKLLGRASRKVSIVNNEDNNYDWNSRGGKVRNTLIQVERTRTGLAHGMGFKTYYYGIGTLNEKRIFRPQYPKVGESKF